MPKTRTRSTQADWTAEAMAMLLESGIDSVKVEPLAKRLNISKSSFYWHFEHRQDLLDAMLDYFIKETTMVLLGSQMMLAANPYKRLAAVMDFVEDENADRYELAMAQWAAKDEKAKGVLSAIYGDRQTFVRNCFEEMGFVGQELEAKTRLFVSYVSWQRFSFPPMPKRNQKAFRRAVLDALLEH